MMLAGTLVSETVPKTGRRNGSVANWAETVAVRKTATRDVRSFVSRLEAVSASASEAETESRKPSDPICLGSIITMAPAASRMSVAKSGLRPTRKAQIAAVATIAARMDGG
jgi:hypothetical protein